jgi:hypothetical protein
MTPLRKTCLAAIAMLAVSIPALATQFDVASPAGVAALPVLESARLREPILPASWAPDTSREPGRMVAVILDGDFLGYADPSLPANRLDASLRLIAPREARSCTGAPIAAGDPFARPVAEPEPIAGLVLCIAAIMAFRVRKSPERPHAPHRAPAHKLTVRRAIAWVLTPKVIRFR